jgi:hypothetical protein
LVPSIEQQLEEALAEVERCEASVAAHPGWQYAKNVLAQAQEKVKRLAAEVENGPNRVDRLAK